MAAIPDDVDLRLYTQLRNPHPTREVFLSFIPPHGLRLQPLETVYVQGDLVGSINRQSIRNQLGFVRAIKEGICELAEMPATRFYDEARQDTRMIQVSSGLVRTERTPAWDPINDLPGLRFLIDFDSDLYSDAARTVVPTLVDDPVYNWDDRKGGFDLRAFDEGTTRPLITAGTTFGKIALRWDGSTKRPLWYPNGNSVVGEETSITMICVFQKNTLGQLSSIMGRGTFGTNGINMTTNAGSSVTFGCSTTGNTTGLGAGRLIAADTWTVMACSYDGAHFRALIDGDSVQSVAKTGPLTFNVADTAFWVGGRTSSGVTSGGNNAKRIALAAVTTDTFDAAELETLVANVKDYMGLP